MDRETESLLILASRTLRFATDHPYATTGILGAVAGSVITYKAMTFVKDQTSEILTPKMCKIALSNEDLYYLMKDPRTELRWETPEVSVIITGEPVKELPVIEYPDISKET